jgi:hypothetical protein
LPHRMLVHRGRRDTAQLYIGQNGAQAGLSSRRKLPGLSGPRMLIERSPWQCYAAARHPRAPHRFRSANAVSLHHRRSTHGPRCG